MCEGRDKADSLIGKAKLRPNRQAAQVKLERTSEDIPCDQTEGQIPTAGFTEGLGFQLDLEGRAAVDKERGEGGLSGRANGPRKCPSTPSLSHDFQNRENYWKNYKM